jgi:hypothetical protein
MTPAERALLLITAELLGYSELRPRIDAVIEECNPVDGRMLAGKALSRLREKYVKTNPIARRPPGPRRPR